MNGDTGGMEADLLAAYAEEAGWYAEALGLARGLPEALRRGEEQAHERLRQVLALLDRVAAREAAVASTRERWHQAGRPTGPPLREVVDRVAALIQELAALVEAAEQEAAAVLARLAPQLDACIRARRMQQAYGGRR
jgi:hypothetical protein